MKIEVWYDDEELTPQIVLEYMEGSEYSTGNILLDKSGARWQIVDIMVRPYDDVAVLFVAKRVFVNKVRPEKGKEIAHGQR